MMRRCWLILICVIGFNGEYSAGQSDIKITSADKLAEFARSYFLQAPGYQPGDLITTKQVVPLIEALAKADWRIEEKESFLMRIEKSGSYLDRVMNNGNGKRFFRQISRFPGGIDRVDRLSKMDKGKSSIDQLVNRMPRGADYIKALATTKHGQIMGRLVRQSKNGQNFNRRTGKIYTEKQLLEELQKIYNDQQQKEIVQR